MSKPILCLDFDGVLHSYVSGWKGPRTIPDPPMPGALEFLVKALDVFEVHVFSSRSRYWFGRRAMKRWLKFHFTERGSLDMNLPPEISGFIWAGHSMEPWQNEVERSADRLVKAIKWPTTKPPAMVTLDDRALQFKGEWPDLTELRRFKPWKPTTADLPRVP